MSGKDGFTQLSDASDSKSDFAAVSVAGNVPVTAAGAASGSDDDISSPQRPARNLSLPNGGDIELNRSGSVVSPDSGNASGRDSVTAAAGTDASGAKKRTGKRGGDVDQRDRPMTEEEKKRAIERFSLRRLLDQAKPERALLIFATFCLFISSLTTLGIPAIMGVIIDAIAAGANDAETVQSPLAQQLARMAGSDRPRPILNAAVGILAVLIFVGALFTFMRAYSFMLAGQRVVARLRKKLFESIIQREVSFFDVTRTGELVNRLATDTTELKDAVTTNMSMALRWAATVVGGLCYLFVISWKLTLVMLSVVPVVAFAGRFYGNKMRENAKATQQALADATTVAEESIGNVRTVRSFYREPFQQSLYDLKVDETLRLGAYQSLLFGAFAGGITFIASGALILVLWYGATLVLNGEMSPGVLTSFLLYTLTVGFALGGLSDLYGTFMKAIGANERVFELIDTPAKINIRGGDVLQPFSGRVAFDDVHFHYPSRPQIQVLGGVSFELAPGTVTALVGPSGGGKSTIVSLIERFYDVSSGSIKLDGKGIKDLDPSWLHRHIGLVSQEPVLFATSLRANLTYGVESASDEQIRRACEMANAHEFISTFTEGYDTMVGERGIRLSGGQKQRVAIARAILMDPAVLIADEATSALDAESEFHVQQALDRLMKGRTVLVVAHRLSTVKAANLVLVVDGGKIVERGTHNELLARSGVYAKLVRRQLTGDVAKPPPKSGSSPTGGPAPVPTIAALTTAASASNGHSNGDHKQNDGSVAVQIDPSVSTDVR